MTSVSTSWPAHVHVSRESHSNVDKPGCFKTLRKDWRQGQGAGNKSIFLHFFFVWKTKLPTSSGDGRCAQCVWFIKESHVPGFQFARKWKRTKKTQTFTLNLLSVNVKTRLCKIVYLTLVSSFSSATWWPTFRHSFSWAVKRKKIT